MKFLAAGSGIDKYLTESLLMEYGCELLHVSSVAEAMENLKSSTDFDATILEVEKNRLNEWLDQLQLVIKLRPSMPIYLVTSLELGEALSAGGIKNVTVLRRRKSWSDSIRDTVYRLIRELQQRQTSSESGIGIYIDPGDASTNTLTELFDALSDLHIAAGGLGLEFVADDYEIHVMEGASR